MQGIFRKENTDKALKYGIYRHLPTYEKIIRNLVSFSSKKVCLLIIFLPIKIIKINNILINNIDVLLLFLFMFFNLCLLSFSSFISISFFFFRLFL
ncbi:hypothetical protein C4T98_00350 [Clostridioides difficile]